ncbi:interferon alpha/beta receptor 2 [Python bivittatus]|uniref:Interferon alpha/beta receptor 2 n=1 Tax=Python bivittatus TaxID=176946 RepID=A0A9F3QVQ7_PYTBI|nr:interferon alpha/beta receptor 2 [Python bivittatus]
MVFSMKPLNFCKLVYIIAITSTFSSLVETSGPPLILNMKQPEDFEYILLWKAGNSSRTPACYTVMYKKMRSVGCNLPTVGTELKSAVKGQEQVNSYNSRSQPSQDTGRHVPGELTTCPVLPETHAQSAEMNYVKSSFKIVQECTNITRLFCNLTNEFADICKEYMYIIVKQDTNNGINYSDLLPFNPFFARCLRPPQFNISVCQSCVKVTVKLLPLLLKVYQELYYTITVKTDVLKENRIHNTTKHESFFSVLEDLHPNKNYCIAVDVSTDYNKQCTPTIPKCVMIDSSYTQDHIILSIFIPIIILVLIFISIILYKAGFIFLKRKTRPSVLNIRPNMANLVFESGLEEVDDVQVQESKEQQYSEDEDSESDIESNLNTKCGILNKISNFSPEVGITQKLSIGCSATSNEVIRTLDTTAEKNQNDTDKSSPITQLYPSKVNSTCIAESEHRGCLNVNLNTVMLGILDEKSDFFTTIDHEDIPESCISDAFEPNHFTEMPDGQSFDVQSPLYSWKNPSVSGESESSDSETEFTSGYMRR